MRSPSLFFALLVGTAVCVPSAHALDAAPSLPTVVEMFTSKYCPNCPPADIKMQKLADTDPSLLVLMEHVDYWNDDEHKDPFGLADITQRQYDYGSALGHRPGEVFTPMPLLNGTQIANPPLWWTWEDALRKARTTPPRITLTLTRAANGGLRIVVPTEAKPKLDSVMELWVMAVTPATPGGKALVVRDIVQAQGNLLDVTLPPALLPKVDGKPATAFVALLQKQGPGAVVGVGRF